MSSYPEHELQRAIHRYLKLAVPHPRAIWAVDHARKATMLQRVRLKERGVVTGCHDHFVLWGGRLITLEIKVGSNAPTEGQHEFADAVVAAGGCCFVVRSIEDVEGALKAAGVPVAASAQGRDEKLAAWQARPKTKRVSKPREERNPAKLKRHMAAVDREIAGLKQRGLI